MENIKIFECVVGSQAYGTATPQSDIDKKYVYVQHPDEILADKYVDQINDNKDYCGFEITKFIRLLATANPTMLELLFSPSDCIELHHPAFDIIMTERDRFLTKKCMMSYCGYAVQQINKAKGLDKKMNWEKERIIRKNPQEFCYIYENGKTITLETFLQKNNLKQENCGLIALNHFKDCYSIFYDYNNLDKPIGYRGISVDNGNSIRLSTIPKDINPIAIMFYNKDGYSMHCRDYKEYETWLKNRNTQRYVDIKGHGQSIDGKNLLHCVRLIETAEEIVTQKTINVRRPNAEELLKIRRGEVNLEELITRVENKMEKIKPLFEQSNLPDEVEEDFIHELILKVRKAVSWS